MIEFAPAKIGQEALRTVRLREGLELQILDLPLGYEESVTSAEEVWNAVDFHFHLQGYHDDELTQVGNREFCIRGSGVRPKRQEYAPEERALEVWLSIESEMLRLILGDESGELPQEVRHWVRSDNELCYARSSKLNLPIRRALWEIVQCPWQGVTKRLFLEGKALELLSLLVEWERGIQAQDDGTKVPAGNRERVHYARELLLQNLHEPLSLAELAQRSQLNEFALKQGFKQEFGQTVFDYLLDYRLEQARQMLERGAMQVSEVMAAVGLKNRSYFAAAFRQKFGQNPKQYQQQF
ncbi:MAG: helix-turn-helix domain-containing protein [Nodosilinea sp.]